MITEGRTELTSFHHSIRTVRTLRLWKISGTLWNYTTNYVLLDNLSALCSWAWRKLTRSCTSCIDWVRRCTVFVV